MADPSTTPWLLSCLACVALVATALVVTGLGDRDGVRRPAAADALHDLTDPADAASLQVSAEPGTRSARADEVASEGAGPAEVSPFSRPSAMRRPPGALPGRERSARADSSSWSFVGVREPSAGSVPSRPI